MSTLDFILDIADCVSFIWLALDVKETQCDRIIGDHIKEEARMLCGNERSWLPFCHGILHTCWYAWIAGENRQDLRSKSFSSRYYPTLVPESNDLCKVTGRG